LLVPFVALATLDGGARELAQPRFAACDVAIREPFRAAFKHEERPAGRIPGIGA
jgi:hypothetical protein